MHVITSNVNREFADIFISTESGDARVLRVTCAAPHVFRVQSTTPGGGFDSCGAAQLLRSRVDGVTTTEHPLRMSVSENQDRIGIAPDVSYSAAKLYFEKATGCIGLALSDGTDVPVVTDISLHPDVNSVSGSLSPGEELYGTGERFDSVARRGKKVRIWAIDRWCRTEGNSYVPVPLFLSTSGYGLFLNRFEASEFDLGADDPDAWNVCVEKAPLDLYLFAHPSPKEMLKAYSELTGFAPEPPEWSFGVHVCRHLRLGEFSTQAGIRQMMAKMDEHRLPYSSVIVEGWDTYERAGYEELKQIADELHNRGKKILVYEACGRMPGFWVDEKLESNERQFAQSGAQESFFLHNEAGEIGIEEAMAYNPADAPDERISRFIDITNPEAVDWWLGNVWSELVEKSGVDGAKIDFCEQIPEHGGIVTFDGSRIPGLHHLYPVAYNAMMFRYFREHRPEGGMCFSRGGGIGAQRYPFMWCGDQLREWRFLGAILKALVSSGFSGIPFMSHDLSGYLPSKDPEQNVEADVFVRGVQMGCFTCNMQTHGTVTRPYDFDEEIVSIYRLYSEIHYALVPYLREQARTASTQGLPILRHLYLEFPDDTDVLGIEDEYMLGDDLLVAPVIDRGFERSIYFPSGTWHCLFDDRTVSGPKLVESWPAESDEIPVFIRTPSVSSSLAGIVGRIRSLFDDHRAIRP